MGIVDNALIGASGQSGYNLTRSLRTRAIASASLTRTPASSSSQNRWTWSGWVKRGTLGVTQTIFSAYSAASYQTYINFTSSDTLQFNNFWGSDNENIITTQVFRDPSAWYHLVFAINLSASTYQNAVQMFVNGVQITAFSTTTFTNSFNAGAVNGPYPHSIGSYATQSSNYTDLYLAEVNFVDGQQLLPSSFGSTNPVTGVWQPRKYYGTYGTNGFYLPFTDNSALTTSSNVGLGKDFSGNGNYWTTNNISITAGVTYDSMTDVPTLTSATAANFAVLNRLFNTPNEVGLSSGNLNYFVGASSTPVITATIGVSSGKWYWEVTATSSNNMLGIISPSGTASMTYVGSTSTSYGYYFTGVKYNNASATAYGASYTTNDVIGVALDLDAGTLTFYKNGTSQGTAFSGLTGTFFPACGNNGAAGNCVFNFGQRPFVYTAPSGYLCLNTYNLPTSTIVKGNTVMDATLYTGNGTSQNIVNAAPFKPDLVWIKSRSNADNHNVFDTLRVISGDAKRLYTNLTNAEESSTFGGATNLTTFNSNGFSVGAGSDTNRSGGTFVGWQWQAGQGTTSSNTNGTITSTVSVNASAGFSVVTYTGTGASATVGHGLGVAPQLIIGRSRTNAFNWGVWHKSLQTLYGDNAWLRLNTSDAYITSFDVFDPQNNTSSVFGIGSEATMNASGSNFVAYCWTPIAGYSAFGSYTGNGSTDGPFVYTNFKPKWVLLKRIDSAADWIIYDAVRNTYNVTNLLLFPDTSGVEETSTVNIIDILSNGFKLRGSAGGTNGSGGTWIYAAFASNPFKNSLAQ